MSDKTPNDGFDLLDDSFIPQFPGTEPDGLTERERAFTFDEDYLDPPRDVGAHEADPVYQVQPPRPGCCGLL